MNRYFHYLSKEGDLLRIKAKRRPGPKTAAACDTWAALEWNREKRLWAMPPYPEVTVRTLLSCRYLGSIDTDEEKEE